MDLSPNPFPSGMETLCPRPPLNVYLGAVESEPRPLRISGYATCELGDLFLFLEI